MRKVWDDKSYSKRQQVCCVLWLIAFLPLGLLYPFIVPPEGRWVEVPEPKMDISQWPDNCYQDYLKAKEMGISYSEYMAMRPDVPSLNARRHQLSL